MTEENRERTREMIKVMQAYVDGAAIEFSLINNNLIIINNNTDPQWNWQVFDYRIASSDKSDSINWDHVAPEFKWMARNKDGEAFVYEEKPYTLEEGAWDVNSWGLYEVSYFSSYKRGTIDWRDSLVERPK